jgi:hypothetical protein
MTWPGAGAIAIEVEVAGGRVGSVAVRSTRPQGLTRCFVGRAAAETPLLARRIYTLCAQAQGAAASGAVALASGRAIEDRERCAAALSVLSERAFETMRACVIGWPWAGGADAVAGRAGGALKEAALAARALLEGAAFGLQRARREALLAPHARLAAAAEALGVPLSPDAAPPADTVFGAISSQCERDQAFAPGAPDSLTRADDSAIVAALRGDPQGFAAQPALPGRRLETGAYARLWRRSSSRGGVLSARLAARLLDIRQALTAVGQGLHLGELECDDVLAAGPAGANAGYGAVESARGRLYHWAEIGPDERISGYAIVAPTEWNFHAAGPFVAGLLGARVGQGEAARLAAARLATLFDPCVAFDVTLKEPAHA